MVILFAQISDRGFVMTEKQARQIYHTGEESTIKKLLELDNENTVLKQKIASFESNSSNSSKPPSTDMPKDRENRKKDNSKKAKSNRKPGGQIGHKGKKRKLKPIEEVDKIIECFSQKCIECKKFNTCKKNNRVGEPIRYQQIEIPPIKPHVTEYQLITLSGKCNEINKGILPFDIAQSCFGSRLTAILAYLTSVCNLSRRKLQDGLKTIFNIDISLGSCQNILEQVSSACEVPCTELNKMLPKSPVINADETGWYKGRWLWVFVTTMFIYFYVAKSRGSIVLKDIIGSTYSGILGVDRWGAYSKYHKGKMQLCWEHLKRDFNKIYDIGCKIDSNEAVIFAETMQRLRKKMMIFWYRFKNDEIDRETLIKKTAYIRRKITKHLKVHINSDNRYIKTLSKKLYKNSQHLFTFIFFDGVEPTNNISERSIRTAVQWRKICFGNRSDKGALLTSRLLTITKTCCLQNKNALEFLVNAISMYRKKIVAPSLLNC